MIDPKVEKVDRSEKRKEMTSTQYYYEKKAGRPMEISINR